MKPFTDRQEAGVILSEQLREYSHNPNAIVLALPRGGVPVAFEISKALSLPLDVLVVRKLGMPGHEEFAMGAITSGDIVIFNDNNPHLLSFSEDQINQVILKEQYELIRREALYRGNHPAPILENKIIILVDDGIATGASMRAAVKALYNQKPKQIIVAVPVAALSTYKEMMPLVDKIICPLKPIDFHAVGLWYVDFSQTTDEEVIDLLEKAEHLNGL